MKEPTGKGVVLAVGSALLMHLALFVLVLPTDGREGLQPSEPPHTYYMGRTSDGQADAEAVRVIKSPVVFSLPSDMGFSSMLSINEVQTRIAFVQPQARNEHFLTAVPTAGNMPEHLNPLTMMLSAQRREPGLPDPPVDRLKTYPVSKRVTLSPALTGRLAGGIVLPSMLNQPVETPWRVRATLGISDQGEVTHVLLDQPLESDLLNQEVLRVLYTLRFKPGSETTGSIEVFSPEPSNTGGGPE